MRGYYWEAPRDVLGLKLGNPKWRMGAPGRF